MTTATASRQSYLNESNVLGFLKSTGIGTRLYELLYNVVGRKLAYEFTTNNYGFAPSTAETAAYGEKYQLQLYFELLSALPDGMPENAHLLEVSSGRGGGLKFVQDLFKPAKSTGLDWSKSAVAWCKKAYPELSFQQGDAHDLPFADGELSVVINVEASHIYNNQRKFYGEVGRVLCQGGYFLLTDYRNKIDNELGILHDDLEAAGLEMVSQRDITLNVYDACIADSQRRGDLVEVGVPRIFRPLMREYSGVNCTGKIEDFKNQTVSYFIYCLRKK